MSSARPGRPTVKTSRASRGDEDLATAMVGWFANVDAALRLRSATTTGTGVVIATYEPAGPVQYGSYELDES